MCVVTRRLPNNILVTTRNDVVERCRRHTLRHEVLASVDHRPWLHALVADVHADGSWCGDASHVCRNVCCLIVVAVAFVKGNKCSLTHHCCCHHSRFNCVSHTWAAGELACFTRWAKTTQDNTPSSLIHQSVACRHFSFQCFRCWREGNVRSTLIGPVVS